jgi:hypothetical protein
MAKSVRKGQSEKQTVNQLFKEMTLMNIKWKQKCCQNAS